MSADESAETGSIDALSAKDHRVREHLANERTYLAWIRTSVTVVGFGFVVARFGVWLRYLSSSTETASQPPPHSGYSLPLGASMVIVGALLAMLGVWRYRRVRRAIDERGQAAAGLAVAIVAILVVLFAIAILFVIFRVA